MITRITTTRQFRSFLTYDLEWIPGTLELRLVGVFDRHRGYRSYRSIASFVDGELTHKNRGRWFYAHAGGLADFQFLLEYLVDRPEFSIEASFSGSSAIIVHVRRGRNVFHFIDSLWLFRDTLRNIGKHVGIAKGNEEENEDFFRTASLHTLREYNYIDCRILYEAIERFEEVLINLGGELKMTIASCGMGLFRRRFLGADIDTSEVINKTAREAYCASRVEVLTSYCEHAYYYDINSSFPHSMLQPQPGEFQGSRDTLPSKGIYIANVDITVPEDYLPPLPKRIGQRLFFPVGSWRGWYSSVDLELLLSSGGRVDKVYEVLTFAEQSYLRDYILAIWELRKNAVGFERQVYKYLMNCVYGKFAEMEIKTRFTANPYEPGPPEDMIAPGMYLSEIIADVPHMHVPISMHITALARRALHGHMSLSRELHYCDTDGFSSTDVYASGNELGDLKLEKIIHRGRFVAPKVYDIEGESDTGEPIHIVRAKGFSKMTPEKFEKLTGNLNLDGTRSVGGLTIEELDEMRRGEEIVYRRMRRIREMVRKGRFRPTEDEIVKVLRNAVPKRMFYPDGHTRPWHIDEIKDLK